MKHLFMLSILLIGILFISVGCQKDDQSEIQEPENAILKRIDFENHNWNKISKQHPVLSDKLNQINAKHSNNRLIASSSYNFTIDDTRVQIIAQENGSTTYAFYVYRDQNSSNVLKLQIGPTLNGDWGITRGSPDNMNEFVITTSNDIENNGSNLMKMVTLSHELIHAYMFSSLENWGYLSYDSTGEPILSLNCESGINYSSINLNSLTDQERFVAIICAFVENNTLTENWTHDLFNSWEFDVENYRNKLQNLLINEHDWNNENLSFKNEAINIFGVNNWIEKVAEASSWIGLENTQEYTQYINSFSNPFEQLYILDIRQKMVNANSNCP